MAAPACTACPGQTVAEPMQENPNIVELASGVDDLSTLVTAVQAADLVDTLSAEGPYTVFAPTNAAFDELPDGVLEDLLANPDELANVLTYHVVEGIYCADDLADIDTLTTVQGDEIRITVTDGGVMVNDAMVIDANIDASNGVVHVIDGVLIPPATPDCTGC
ncbi:fasciclin domain-containing protein [Methanoculleus sp. FWC-SCC1]|uniref:Fasciclin domain-containing protein n=2 Tax=Methanoculleus frigidifontis TaxID=2584085 RepID=A0ABT8MDB6_9EURY|nr:fasciclin domain-containing protein [Methanoculleus sp. FWC-SCC1]